MVEDGLPVDTGVTRIIWGLLGKAYKRFLGVAAHSLVNLRSKIHAQCFHPLVYLIQLHDAPLLSTTRLMR